MTGSWVTPATRAARPRGLVHRSFDWMYRSRVDGTITLGQFPNLSQGLFVGAVVLRWFLGRRSDARPALGVVAAGSLVWWAFDELFRGVNPHRRLTGLGTLVMLGARAIR